MNRFYMIALTALFLFACAHHRDVRPGPNGLNKVVIKTDDRDEGSRNAIAQANHYCESIGRSAVFEDEDQKYTGDMDEKSYNNAKRASKVAKVVGGTAHIFGGKTESNIGGIVGLGGIATDAALGNGYAVTMKFRCK